MWTMMLWWHVTLVQHFKLNRTHTTTLHVAICAFDVLAAAVQMDSVISCLSVEVDTATFLFDES